MSDCSNERADLVLDIDPEHSPTQAHKFDRPGSLNILTRMSKAYLGVYALGAVCIVVLIASLFSNEHLQSLPSCGSTISSAQKRGCLFDPMSFSWLPAECLEQDLIQDFLNVTDWHWYLDINGTMEAPRATVLTGQYPELFVTREYHRVHCVYMWRKMHRGLERGVIDTYIGNYHHTAHCEQMLLENVPSETIDTMILLKFPGCRTL
ncbi:uncharacterized protein A1O9_01462 [Exophiala aquamarina CBS 119918]|uniref:Uncharacterized protein n=1 Tax=Exophiala aquamarina CBS 119918 TaxID=1182545 RepID=A0A072PTQ3_9EURO|nr:uncharacterized protein A1O9_01462 [Exophiala aquamarina CBS 119918]KEF63484.1 hypothetical protein A1O9_01462 [Exophiala aquamarina CBS 119918]